MEKHRAPSEESSQKCVPEGDLEVISLRWLFIEHTSCWSVSPKVLGQVAQRICFPSYVLYLIHVHLHFILHCPPICFV